MISINTFSIYDKSFINGEIYQSFLKDNPSRGFLNIRAYAASQAVPISDLKVEVSTIVSNNKIILFEGLTNSSGVISSITLPAPKLDIGNLDTPKTTVYEIAVYGPNNFKKTYKVNIYENVSVVQNISIVPEGGM